MKSAQEDHTSYISPFSQRYASKEMQHIFSDEKKFTTWRELWVILAEVEKELGLNISDEQITELKSFMKDVNYDTAKAHERKTRHDVMAHIHAYGDQCPNAKGIIHLGATSCYVTDNTDIIVMKEGLKLLRKKLINVISQLASFAEKYKDLPTLGFTHFQSAQLVTVGKRTTLWIQDLLMDLKDIDYVTDSLQLLGSKGTTGTQASFLELFDGDHEKVKRADKMIAERLGFDGCYPVSGQTYSRKIDSRVVNVIAGIAQSASKFGNDIRLLQHLKEIEEPFGEDQVGSSAMAYKRNPMNSERMVSLCRHIIDNGLNPAHTAAVQWLERTLDDSANKRISVSEAFLAIDGVLDLYSYVTGGLVVYPKVMEKHIIDELPFMMTENILMEAVKSGADRQQCHEKIRVLSMEAGRRVKEEGLDNNLLELISIDPTFKLSIEDLKKVMQPIKYVGRAPEQVTEFLSEHITPVLEANKDSIIGSAKVLI